MQQECHEPFDSQTLASWRMRPPAPARIYIPYFLVHSINYCIARAEMWWQETRAEGGAAAMRDKFSLFEKWVLSRLGLHVEVRSKVEPFLKFEVHRTRPFYVQST
jgi:hypothetical protein